MENKIEATVSESDIVTRQENTAGHVHSHDNHHGHHHSPDFSKKTVNRLAKAQGHLAKVKHMAENEEDCIAIITQLLAVKSALDSTAKFILKEHMSHCILDAAKEGDVEAVKELQKIIDSFIK